MNMDTWRNYNLPLRGTRFTYKRWNSYAPNAQPVESWTGEVVDGSYDLVGASVVVAVTDGGETKEFYNDSWFEPGFLVSIEAELG